MMAATKMRVQDLAAAPAATATETPLRVGWAVRNAAGAVVVIYVGHDAEAVAQEWVDDSSYTVEAVSV